MPTDVHSRTCSALQSAIPEMQRDFLMAGPLRGSLPADIRADIVRVFTQVLCRAIKSGDGTELGAFVDSVVWEARKMGAPPVLFVTWLDKYCDLARTVLDDGGWVLTEPMLRKVRVHIERLQN